MAFFILATDMLSNTLLRRLWVGIGWFGVVLLIFLSLTPQPPEIPIEQGDKFGHAFAYAMLMYWWAQLLRAARQRLRAGGSPAGARHRDRVRAGLDRLAQLSTTTTCWPMRSALRSAG